MFLMFIERILDHVDTFFFFAIKLNINVLLFTFFTDYVNLLIW